jgi:hypothetical protein
MFRSWYRCPFEDAQLEASAANSRSADVARMCLVVAMLVEVILMQSSCTIHS